MAWEWLEAVGTWAGNDGSTLLAGALGAGAALLGGRLGQRRRERREDTAAWRDKRHEAYALCLNNALDMEFPHSFLCGFFASFYERPVSQGVMDTQYKRFSDAYSAYYEANKKLRLMASKRVWDEIKQIESDGFDAILEFHISDLAATPPTAETVTKAGQWRKRMKEKVDRLEMLMRDELGLPDRG